MRQERLLLLSLEREIGAGVDLALAGLMPAGKQRQAVVRDWFSALMPWVDAADESSEDYLVGRWKARFGEKEDGQQPE